MISENEGMQTIGTIHTVTSIAARELAWRKRASNDDARY